MNARLVVCSFLAVLLFLSPVRAAAGETSVASASAELWLSPVVTGDCVASRIYMKRSAGLDEFDRQRCARKHREPAQVQRCLEHVRYVSDGIVTFFTDRCSESDYFIGVNGREYRLKRTSKKRGKPTDFIGSFAGEGLTMTIGNPRLIEKLYEEGQPKTERNLVDAVYAVDVTVKLGSRKQTFAATLWYGR